MKIDAKTVRIKDGEIGLKSIQTEDIKVPEESIMSIDGSTTDTGVSILRRKDGAIYYTAVFTRENDESPVRYKIRLKNEIAKILLNNNKIRHVYYEEPFIGFAQAATNLMMLRAFVEELIIENEPTLDYIKHIEVNNKRWKKIFLAPDKCPNNSRLEKEAVKKKLVHHLPFMADTTQDEIDATAMGFAAILMMQDGREDQMKSRTRPRPFKYNIRFVGANDDEYMLQEFMNVYDGPDRLTDNGITFVDIGRTTKFDRTVYDKMDNEDKVLVLKFSSDHHGNLILEHRLGRMAAENDYIYAIVWRKYRKRN